MEIALGRKKHPEGFSSIDRSPLQMLTHEALPQRSWLLSIWREAAVFLGTPGLLSVLRTTLSKMILGPG